MALTCARSVLAALMALAPWVAAAQAPAPSAAGPASPAEIREFLLRAEVVKSHEVGKGVTGIRRLTLRAGAFEHDAAFQTIDERKLVARFRSGGGEIGFADSYHFNIAAYELAVLLGLDHMVPVTVERTWRREPGSLSWWVDAEFDEGERLKRKLAPPDPARWNAQMHRARVFTALIYDTDRNLGNTLISGDWTIWIIDFTRAFRRQKAIKAPADLTRCDRRLFASLQALDRDEVRQAVGSHLAGDELSAVMGRRDLIVAHFQKLIAERGESSVLY